MDQYLSFIVLAQGLAAVSGIAYLNGVIRKKITPNLASWIIWSVIGTALYFTTQASLEASESTKRFALVLAIIPSTIALVSLWFGRFQKITIYDLVALILATLALIWWWKTKNEPTVLPIALAILADISALIPTVMGVRRYPESDKPFPWLCFSFGSILALFGADNLNFATLALPIYMAIAPLFVAYPLVQSCLKRGVDMKHWI